MVLNVIDGEREALLRPSSHHSGNDGSRSRPTWWRWVIFAYQSLRNNPIITCTFLLQFLTYFAKHLVEVPLIKLFEQAVCNRYYASHGDDISSLAISHFENVDESRCKIQIIQREVAELVGLKFTFEALPALITALYYGSVADRFGRRLVLALCCTGTACSLLWILFVCYADELNIPVKYVWASSLFLLLGGSQRVAKGMNFTIIADATDRAHRTRFMYLLAGIPHITTLITPPLSGILMRISTWVPFAFAIGAYVLGLLVLLFMPESLNRASSIRELDNSHDHGYDQEHDPLLEAWDSSGASESVDAEASEVVASASDQRSPESHNQHPAAPSSTRRSWWRDIATLFRMRELPFCFILFFFKPMAMIAKAYVYQYASYNFGWNLSETTWLRFAQAGGSCSATIVVLPLLSSLLDRKGRRAQQLDLNVIRSSLLIAIVGFLLLQFSSRVWMLLMALFICGLSEGEEPALQGLTTSLIDASYHARLFTSVTVVEIVAKLVGGPMMGKLFSIGRSDHIKGSAGICFSVSAGILFCLMVFAMIQKLDRVAD